MSVGIIAVACSTPAGPEDDAEDQNDDRAQSSGGGDSLEIDPDGMGGQLLGSDGGASGLGGDHSGIVCETVASSTKLIPVFLAFAFDVSGSMGMNHAPEWWYNPNTKWTPVVDATRAFLEDSASSGVSASMSLFPSPDAADEGRCDAATYEEPDVPMVSLPSTEFGSVFDDYEAEVGDPLSGGNWRGGTPTLAALEGTASYLDQFRDEQADAAVVLVTDGEPQGCDENAIDSVIALAAELLNDGIPTYVIGIENPTAPPEELPEGWSDWGECTSGTGGDDVPCQAPENLSSLNGVAEAGGTESPFLIDTGDADATRLAFSAAIDAIRSRELSCELEIPQHPQGAQGFLKDNIDVTVQEGSDSTQLAYDADCSSDLSWRYNDEGEPTRIELCPTTCEEIQSKKDSELKVNFLCQPRIPVIR